jgi:hypothetical protein
LGVPKTSEEASDPASYFEEEMQEHISTKGEQDYDRITRVQAFMRECGIKPKRYCDVVGIYDYIMNHRYFDLSDMKILMWLLCIDCPDYEDYFFTSKGDLLNHDNHVFAKTQVFRDLWEFLDFYGIKYEQRGPKFNSQTLGVSVCDDQGRVDVYDIFIATKDNPKNETLEIISINNKFYDQFLGEFVLKHLPQEFKIIQQNNGHKIYISDSDPEMSTGPSSRTALTWGVYAAVHGLETPKTVFTGSINRKSGEIEKIGKMYWKHAAATHANLGMIVPQENLYKNEGRFQSFLPYNRYSNVKSASSVQELFSIASSMKPLDRGQFSSIYSNKFRYKVNPTRVAFARFLNKLP